MLTIAERPLSWRDLILIGGGLFLIGKATHGSAGKWKTGEGTMIARPIAAPSRVIVQIIVIDLVFSLDSIITAIGMASDLAIMIAAVVIACVVMYVVGPGVEFRGRATPPPRCSALAFLVLIGVALVADGFKFHIPRGYIYFAIAFSAAVEFFNVLAKRNRRKAPH